MRTRAFVPVRKALKALVLFGLVGGAVWFCVHLFPTLINGLPGVGK